MTKTNWLVLAVFTCGAAPACADGGAVPAWGEVSAIFDRRCVMCHSEVAGASKGLRLDSYAAAMIGSERGPVLIAGDAIASELMRRVRGASQPRMPFLGPPLPDAEIAVIETWIAAGLPEEAASR